MLRSAALAATLVVIAALFGAVTVKLELGNKLVIVTHLAIAMALLAVFVSAVMRTGGLGAGRDGKLPRGRAFARKKAGCH